MPVFMIDGQEKHMDVEWVSHEVYKHCQSGKKWDSKNFILVDIGNALSAWITKDEKEILSRINDVNDIEKFAMTINITPVLKEQFLKWKEAS